MDKRIEEMDQYIHGYSMGYVYIIHGTGVTLEEMFQKKKVLNDKIIKMEQMIEDTDNHQVMMMRMIKRLSMYIGSHLEKDQEMEYLKEKGRLQVKLDRLVRDQAMLRNMISYW